jgi:hypothetical protein
MADGQAYASTATVSVAFTPGAEGGSAITGFTVTSSSGVTNTGASSPITISDSIGTSRTYTVTADNIYGTSDPSTASAPVIPATIPQVPTIGSPSRVNNSTVSLPFTGSNGGSTLTSLAITSSPAVTLSYTGVNSPLSVSGSFAVDQTYTFIMSATSARGSSANSASSSGVIPNPTPPPPPPPPPAPPAYPNIGTVIAYGAGAGQAWTATQAYITWGGSGWGSYTVYSL